MTSRDGGHRTPITVPWHGLRLTDRGVFVILMALLVLLCAAGVVGQSLRDSRCAAAAGTSSACGQVAQ